MSRPVDRRLLAAAPALRRHLLVAGSASALGALLVVAQAQLLATVVAGVFGRHADGRWLLVRLAALAAVGLAKAALAARQEWSSARASVRVRAQLRSATLAAIVALGPSWAER